MLKNLNTVINFTVVIALMFFANAFLVYINFLKAEGKFEFNLPVLSGILLLIAMALLGYRGNQLVQKSRIKRQNYVGVDQKERMEKGRAGSRKFQ